MLERGSVVSASPVGLPEYGAAVNAGLIPADNPQVVNFLAVGDFSGDGRDDVMVVRALYQSNRTFPVVVLVNQGNGTFVDQTSSIFDGAPPQTMDARRVVVADFNGDGRPDVFVADEGQYVTPNYGHQNTLILRRLAANSRMRPRTCRSGRTSRTRWQWPT
jgi:hypothetical protein